MTKEIVKAHAQAILAIGDCIKELGGVPSGHLYARLMGSMSLESYQSIIGILKSAGIVKEENFFLTYIGK